ncbi:MAG: phytanoyl-CoA dioxygenase family protein [Alphaproteobacteria bacterium]|nr:phytanoyl-CoA dioxygenase family protein [Alphaproteobacteria bacterium]
MLAERTHDAGTRTGLPGPRTDLAAARADLDAFGYCVVENVLAAEEIRALKTRLVEQAAGERARGVSFRDGGPGMPNQRVWMLVNKGRIFRDLMLHPVIDDLIGHMLGREYLLSSLTCNIAAPGGEPMVLHQDQGWSGIHTPMPLAANIAWMLDDFTAANGATRLAPGSHLDQSLTPRSSAYAPEGTVRYPAMEDTIAAEGKAGSILCFDGRTWHGTGDNTSGAPRHGLLSFHCRPFIRQQENYALGLLPEILASERPALLNRLGFKPWAGLGRVEHPRPQTPLFVSAQPVGPLASDGTRLGSAL